MTWHNGARILEAGIAFDAAFHQVAQNTRKPIYQAEHQCLRNRHGYPGNKREQAPEPHGHNKTGYEAFPAFLWGDMGRKLVLTDRRSDQIGKGIVAPNAGKQAQNQNRAPRIREAIRVATWRMT